MYDLKMDGRQPAPVWFWISLILLIIATIIFYVIVQDDRWGQKNTGNQTELIQNNK
jgi:hypothetical protein